MLLLLRLFYRLESHIWINCVFWMVVRIIETVILCSSRKIFCYSKKKCFFTVHLTFCNSQFSVIVKCGNTCKRDLSAFFISRFHRKKDLSFYSDPFLWNIDVHFLFEMDNLKLCPTILTKKYKLTLNSVRTHNKSFPN